MEMEHLDTTCSPSRQEHQKALYLGVKLQVRQQKKRTRTTEEKRPCAPLTLRFWRAVEVEVLVGEWNSLATAGPKNYGYGTRQGKVDCKVRGFSGVAPGLGEGNGRGTWRTKKAFHLRGGGGLCAWVGAERRIQKVEMFKVLLLVTGKIHCHYH